MEQVDPSAVLRQAFTKCIESIEYWLGQGDGAPICPDPEMARIKAEVARELLKHPSAIDCMDNLSFRRLVKRFRELELNVGKASLDQREVVEHWTRVELNQAQNTVRRNHAEDPHRAVARNGAGPQHQ
jgi:hypothetical protein